MKLMSKNRVRVLPGGEKRDSTAFIFRRYRLVTDGQTDCADYIPKSLSSTAECCATEINT